MLYLLVEKVNIEVVKVLDWEIKLDLINDELLGNI